MNRVDIEELRIQKIYPAITLIGHCDKKKLHDTFMSLVSQVKDTQEQKVITELFTQALNDLICPADHSMIALFANKNQTRSYTIPFPTEEIATVSNEFALEHLTAALNRGTRHWILELTEERPILYDGYDHNYHPTHLTCLSVQDNPLSTLTYENLADCMAYYLEQDPLPLYVVGEKNKLHEHKNLEILKDSVTGYVAKLPQVWPLAQQWYKNTEQNALKTVRTGKKNHDYILEFENIVKAAHEGMIETLIVSHNYHHKGCEDPVSGDITLTRTCPADQIPINAIDMVIELVKEANGTVLLPLESDMSDIGHIAALIRKM